MLKDEEAWIATFRWQIRSTPNFVVTNNHLVKLMHRALVGLNKQTRSRDHDRRDEREHAGKQKDLVYDAGHGTLPRAEFPSLRDRRPLQYLGQKVTRTIQFGRQTSSTCDFFGHSSDLNCAPALDPAGDSA
jgi:hypothetical protein